MIMRKHINNFTLPLGMILKLFFVTPLRRMVVFAFIPNRYGHMPHALLRLSSMKYTVWYLLGHDSLFSRHYESNCLKIELLLQAIDQGGLCMDAAEKRYLELLSRSFPTVAKGPKL